MLITDAWMSPASEAARHVITFDLESPSPFDSPIGALAIIEVLVAGVAMKLGDQGRDRVRQVDKYNRTWMWDGRLLIGADEPGQPQPGDRDSGH